jgi:hypothetical protein
MTFLKDSKVSLTKGTHRRVDDNGRLCVSDCILTAAQINDYLGSEIDHDGSMGLDPQKVYRVFRTPESLRDAVDAFNTNLPLKRGHTFDYPDSADDEKERIGAVSNVRFDDGTLFGDVSLWDQQDIELAQSGECDELSVGYDYECVLEPGEFDGAPYDIKIVAIRPNHIALCPKGRVQGAGLADAKPINLTKRMSDMAKKKMMDAFASFLKAKKITLKDEEVQELEKTLGDNIVDKLEEILAPLIQDQKLRQQVIESVLPFYESGEAHGESMAASVPDKTEKPAEEEGKDSEVGDLKEKLNKMESAFEELKVAFAAKAEVEPETGDLGVMDSASAYYKAGCAALGIDPKNIVDSDLRATFRAATKFAKQKTGKTGDSAKADELSDACKKIRL